MKEKFYSMNAKVTDKDGNERVITVVGQFINTREKIEVEKDVKTTNFKGNAIDAKISFKEKTLLKTFTMACSICCPTDTFDEEKGIEIAKKRLKTNPIGTLVSSDFSMLNPDMCNILLLNELKYIATNLDKVIARF